MTSAIMKINNVTMDFRGLRALNQVQFDVKQGSITGIIGPNGAGKTTLFNIIAGKYKPTAGYVSFEDQKIAGLSPDKICRMGISRTYQTDRPFGGLSVHNNVKVALLHGHGQAKHFGHVGQDISEVLEFVKLSDVAEKCAEELIPLDRKRLEVARALATDPQLLLLDELIAGLTPTETLEMMEMVRAINKRGITVLFIEHVMKAVMGLSDKIIVLHHGEKIAEGSPTDISTNEKVIQAYLGSKH